MPPEFKSSEKAPHLRSYHHLKAEIVTEGPQSSPGTVEGGDMATVEALPRTRKERARMGGKRYSLFQLSDHHL